MSTSAPQPLRLRRLHLETFRNYADLRLDLHPGVNVFVGQNGSGKTNLLEAVAYLAIGRSPRTARDADLVMEGGTQFAIDAEYDQNRGLRAESVGVRYRMRQGRTALLGGTPAPTASALYGRVLVVFFCPDDLLLVKGAPAGRRQLLDRLLVQSAPVYADALLRYRQALAQRNATLHEVRARRTARALLAIWEPQLVQYGAEILQRRGDAVQALAPRAAQAYARFAGSRTTLTCTYAPGLPAGGAGADRWPDRLRAALQRAEEGDISAATTTVGPHRDDLDLRLAGRPAARFGSQGEQRTVTLALKFAERAWLAAATGRLPVLLVDDVLSELDPQRRDALRSMLAEEGQVFLTTADAEHEAHPSADMHYMVSAGRVVPGRTPA